MANEYFEVQTYADVQQIDHRRETNFAIDNQVQQQNDNMQIISNQLDSIATTLDTTDAIGNVDLTEITDKIDEIDTTVITAQTEDILITVQKQNNEIEALKEQNKNLENKIDLILNKLEEM